jgi:hypothetical protein
LLGQTLQFQKPDEEISNPYGEGESYYRLQTIVNSNYLTFGIRPEAGCQLSASAFSFVLPAFTASAESSTKEADSQKLRAA